MTSLDSSATDSCDDVTGSGSTTAIRSELIDDESTETSQNELSDFTDSSTQTNSFFPGFSDPADGGHQNWQSNHCFSRYWKHYSKVMEWCKKHKKVSKVLEPPKPCHSMPGYNWNCCPNGNFNIYSYYSQYYQHCSQYFESLSHAKLTVSSRKRRRNRLKRRRMRAKLLKAQNKSPGSGREKSDASLNDSIESDEFEMEINDEMVDFFAKSQEHRQQRDLIKDDEQQRVNVEEAHASTSAPSVEAPKERPGARRTAEMKQLYGKGAAMIHGMETALQMSYDRIMDTKQPNIWPNMPLRIIFN